MRLAAGRSGSAVLLFPAATRKLGAPGGVRLSSLNDLLWPGRGRSGSTPDAVTLLRDAVIMIQAASSRLG